MNQPSGDYCAIPVSSRLPQMTSVTLDTLTAAAIRPARGVSVSPLLTRRNPCSPVVVLDHDALGSSVLQPLWSQLEANRRVPCCCNAALRCTRNLESTRVKTPSFAGMQTTNGLAI